MACVVMAYVVMAYVVMAYMVMAYIVMAYIVMAYIGTMLEACLDTCIHVHAKKNVYAHVDARGRQLAR